MNLKTIEEIEVISKDLKAKNKIIVTTSGSYDIIHSAHVNLLKKAKSLGDILIILLNSDNSVKRLKGEKRPIILENERAFLLSELKPVDYVVIFPQDKPLEYLERIKPDIHVKGGSYIVDRIIEEEQLIATWNGKYKTFELEPEFSSTDIINKILELYKD